MNVRAMVLLARFTLHSIFDFVSKSIFTSLASAEKLDYAFSLLRIVCPKAIATIRFKSLRFKFYVF